MKRTKQEFRRLIQLRPSFIFWTLLVYTLCTVLVIVAVLLAILLGNKGADIPFLLYLILSDSGAVFIFYLYNKYWRNKVVAECYDAYLENGIIKRIFTLKSPKRKYALLLVEKNRNFTQHDYDILWEAFEQYCKENKQQAKIANDGLKDQWDIKTKKMNIFLTEFTKYFTQVHMEYRNSDVYVIPHFYMRGSLAGLSTLF